MLLKTRHFGEIDIDENEVLSFEEGLPGFEGVKRYIILGNSEDEYPFKWLQGIDDPSLAFVVIDPLIIKKDYDFEIKENIIKLLSIEKVEDVRVYCIVVVPDDISKISMNLKAPVIVN